MVFGISCTVARGSLYAAAGTFHNCFEPLKTVNREP